MKSESNETLLNRRCSTLREWLREKRMSKNMTHMDVARASGIQRPYYTMIENGTRNPGVDVAKRIGMVLDFDWTIFFDKQSNETKHKTA